MKIFLHSLVMQFFLLPVFAFAQTSVNDVKSAKQMVNVQQQQFRDYLTSADLDANIKKELQKFAINDVNHLQSNLQYFASASKDRRIKGIRSLGYFMKELQNQLKEQKVDQYKIP